MLLLRLLSVTHFFLFLIVLHDVEADIIERRLQSTHISRMVLKIWCLLTFLMHRGHLIGRQKPFALFGMLFLNHLNPFTEAFLVLFFLSFLRFQHFLVLSS